MPLVVTRYGSSVATSAVVVWRSVPPALGCTPGFAGAAVTETVAAGAAGAVVATAGGTVAAGFAAAGAAVGATAGAVVGAAAGAAVGAGGATFVPVHAARTLRPAVDTSSRSAARRLTNGTPPIEWLLMALPRSWGRLYMLG